LSILDENEDSVKSKVRSYAESKGWIYFLIDYAGWPDDLFVGPKGQHVWIEFKRPKGGRHKLRQKYRLATLVGMGCDAYLVKTVQHGKTVIDVHS